ncbi:MAG: diguanylate cyclase [Clostridia bacterium]|nr:diguanylate cyclase [Clostridia bacterium]
MNKFNLLRYLSKWKYLIFVVCVLGALLVYKYAMYNQEYTASTVISYTNSDASKGRTPSGDDLDVTEVYSSAVITNVLEDLNLNIGADAIRSKCRVEGITPPDEETKKEAILEQGEEYEFFPTDYVVSFSVGSEYNKDFARMVLDSIIKNYFATYGEKYINQQTLPNNNVRGTDGHYDYIERAEILDAWTMNISDYLAAKKETQPNYRSAATGYSFTDLYEIYESYMNYDLPQIYSLILEQEVTEDRDTLIKKYQSDISTYELDLQNMQTKINDLNDLITKYSNKNKEGAEYHFGTQAEEGNNSSDYILKDVYKEFDAENEISSETTYDSLINEYVELETEKEKLQVDLDHKKKILSVFTDGAETEDKSNTQTIEESLDELSKKLDEMYSIVSDTVDEYNQYVGAYNVSTLASITTEEKINVKMYIFLAIIIFFFGGCIGAIILGRSKEFLDYIMYTDRKTGLPNRAMCDIEIEKYAAEKLKDSFVFTLIRIDNLKYVNDKGGREAGDALLKAFGKILKRAASSYGFVGYNGSDQFIGMFEECTLERANDFKQYLEELVRYHNVQSPNVNIQLSVVVSETNDEEIYDIRKLMGITFRKASSFNNRDEKKTDTDKAEAKNVSEETKTQENKQ